MPSWYPNCVTVPTKLPRSDFGEHSATVSTDEMIPQTLHSSKLTVETGCNVHTTEAKTGQKSTNDEDGVGVGDDLDNNANDHDTDGDAEGPETPDQVGQSPSDKELRKT